MEEKYSELIKEKIELDKLLSLTKKEYHDEIKKLLEEKKKVMKENGFWAEYKLNKIYKRIEKIKNLTLS